MYFMFAAFYVVLLVVFGVLTFRRRHMVLFILGFFLPVLWLVGALIPPSRPVRA